MKVLSLSTVLALVPALASAHGGHPETGASVHEFAHVLWFGLPVALAVFTMRMHKRWRKDD